MHRRDFFKRAVLAAGLAQLAHPLLATPAPVTPLRPPTYTPIDYWDLAVERPPRQIVRDQNGFDRFQISHPETYRLRHVFISNEPLPDLFRLAGGAFCGTRALQTYEGLPERIMSKLPPDSRWRKQFPTQTFYQAPYQLFHSGHFETVVEYTEEFGPKFIPDLYCSIW